MLVFSGCYQFSWCHRRLLAETAPCSGSSCGHQPLLGSDPSPVPAHSQAPTVLPRPFLLRVTLHSCLHTCPPVPCSEPDSTLQPNSLGGHEQDPARPQQPQACHRPLSSRLLPGCALPQHRPWILKPFPAPLWAALPVTASIREKWKWGIAYLWPIFYSFFFPFRWCMYNAYLFGGKTAGCRRSILVDILTYSEKGKFSHANRYLGFFFLIYWIYRRKFNSPLATQVSSCTLDSWAIFPRASLFRFLPSSVSSLMVSWVSELLPFWWCMGLFAPALC